MDTKIYLTNNRVSTLGFGAWPLGNTSSGHTMSEEEGIALVKKAFYSGINFFDTAPNYALGRSETILGKALSNVRDKVIINTKFGHHVDGIIDFDVNKLRSSIEGSLKRLNTTYIDSVILHNPNKDILMGQTSHFAILDMLKKEGLIKGYGVSIDTDEEVELTLKYLKVDVIELLFNVFAQSSRHYFDEIKKREISLIIKVPLDSGWLTGKYHKNMVFDGIRSRWTKHDIHRRHNLVQAIKEHVHSEDLTKYALGFIWSYDAVTTIIPGMRTETQLSEHINAWKSTFDYRLKSYFENFYDEKIKKEPLPW